MVEAQLCASISMLEFPATLCGRLRDFVSTSPVSKLLQHTAPFYVPIHQLVLAHD